MKFSAMILAVLPSGVFAQPFSESMAECAAIYQNGAQWVQSDAAADKLMQATRNWADAAIRQASAEGHSLSDDAMWDKIDAKTDAWEAKGAEFIFSQEFRDWTEYCRAFGRDQGIDVPS